MTIKRTYLNLKSLKFLQNDQLNLLTFNLYSSTRPIGRLVVLVAAAGSFLLVDQSRSTRRSVSPGPLLRFYAVMRPVGRN